MSLFDNLCACTGGYDSASKRRLQYQEELLGRVPGLFIIMFA